MSNDDAVHWAEPHALEAASVGFVKESKEASLLLIIIMMILLVHELTCRRQSQRYIISDPTIMTA